MITPASVPSVLLQEVKLATYNANPAEVITQISSARKLPGVIQRKSRILAFGVAQYKIAIVIVTRTMSTGHLAIDHTPASRKA